jgi:TorA maturation chaperone TorD
LARAAIYSFLSRGFKKEVDSRFLQNVGTIEPTLGLLSRSQTGSELIEAHKLLAEFADASKDLGDEKKDALLTSLAAEYAGLFLGMGPKPVHPVESVYLGGAHLLYEQPYHEVVQVYKNLGYEKDKNFKEPEDHVAVEFDFMANLCKWTSKTLDDGDVDTAIRYLSLQKEFLKNHMTRWVPALCQELSKTANSSFYKALAHLANGFVAMDDQVPDHLKEDLEKRPKE